MKSYIEGLRRVAKIPLADSVYAKAYEEFFARKYNFILEYYINRDYEGIVSIFRNEINKFYPYRIIYDNEDIITYANTENNKKFINSFLDDVRQTLNINIELYNLADYFTKERVKDDSIEFMKKAIVSYFWEFIWGKPLSLLLIHNCFQFSFAYITFTTLFKNNRPKLMVIANDHSSFPVALSMVMYKNNIKQVYLQHGYVTKNFPQLIFDYSILWNKKTYDMYTENSKLSKDILVYDYKYNKVSPKKIIENIKFMKYNKFNIVIYLSDTIDEIKLREAYTQLKQNKQIYNIYVKPHPRNINIHRYINIEHKYILNEIPQFKHVGVVCNSSIVFELLSRDVPIFINYEIDGLNYDYYGFSEHGFIQELKIFDMKGNFIEKFHLDEKIYRKILSDYFFFIQSNFNTFNYARHDIFLLKIFSFKFNKDKFNLLKNEYVFREKLNMIPATFIESSVKFDDDILSYCNKLFNERKFNFAKLYPMVKKSKKCSLFNMWVVLKKATICQQIEKHDLLSCITYLYANNTSGNVLRAFENLIFEVLFDVGDDELFLYFIMKTGTLSLKRMTERNILKYLMYDFKNEKLNENKNMIKHGLRGIPLLRLKIMQLESTSMNEKYSHIYFENLFVKSVSNNICTEFLCDIKPIYNNIRKRMKFIDVRINNEYRCELIDFLKSRIANKIPFSLIRLSDGEGYIFEDKYFSILDKKNRERHWWGNQLPGELRNKLIDDLNIACEYSDMLGIPSIYRFIRDISNSSTSLFDSLTVRGCVNVLLAIPRFTQCIFTEERVNAILFDKKNQIDSLISVAERVIFISSIRENIFRKVFINHNIIYIEIPTHARNIHTQLYSQIDECLPYCYPDITGKINRICKDGDLVLVSAGIVGKIFINDAKKCGAIAIDIGSSIDIIFNNIKLRY